MTDNMTDTQLNNTLKISLRCENAANQIYNNIWHDVK
jgi:hypothetical protein